jgi:hypothetical protein
VPTADLIALFVAPINRLDVEYMVTGAIAAIIYGEPRLTNDIDIVASLSASDPASLVAAFPSPEYYVPPVEAIETERSRPRHGHFNIIHVETALKADIYPAGEDDLNAWALERKRRFEIGAEAIWVAPPEYVVLLKLEYWQAGGSEKHLGDIRAMLRVLGDDVDREFIAAEVIRRGLDDLWRRASVPSDSSR